MDGQQLFAGAIAGLVAPFIQQTFFGGRIHGRPAAVLAVVIALALGTLSTWASGGFSSARAAPLFDPYDPSAFFIFWAGIFTPVYAASQFFYSITTKRSESPPATGIIQTVAKVVQPVIGIAPPAPPPKAQK